VRLSEARARLELKTIVTREHAEVNPGHDLAAPSVVQSSHTGAPTERAQAYSQALSRAVVCAPTTGRRARRLHKWSWWGLVCDRAGSVKAGAFAVAAGRGGANAVDAERCRLGRTRVQRLQDERTRQQHKGAHWMPGNAPASATLGAACFVSIGVLHNDEGQRGSAASVSISGPRSLACSIIPPRRHCDVRRKAKVCRGCLPRWNSVFMFANALQNVPRTGRGKAVFCGARQEGATAGVGAFLG
jgi:hypothetical protein